jgi:hypothetical protein
MTHSLKLTEDMRVSDTGKTCFFSLLSGALVGDSMFGG